MARYVIKEGNDGSGCLTALIIGIIVLIVIAVFAAYILGFIIGLILLVSAVLGSFITIKNYILALRDAFADYGRSESPNSKIPNFFYRWFKVSLETIKDAWVYNIESVKDCFGKAGFYKFFSFKKWMYLISALSVLLFGTLLSFAVVLLHVYLITVVLRLVLIALLVICAVFALIGLGVAVGFSTTNYISRLRESFGSSATTFFEYIVSMGYSEYINIIKEYCNECMSYVKNGFSEFGAHPLFSPKRWFALWNAIMTVIVGSIMLLVFGVIHLIVLSVLFAIFKVISLFKR